MAQTKHKLHYTENNVGSTSSFPEFQKINLLSKKEIIFSPKK